MSSTYPPKKATAFTLNFNLYDTAGDPANATTVTRLVSKDGGAYATVAAAVSEINGTYGFYSVVLNATEMNADRVSVYLCGTATTCVPYTATLYTAAQTLDEIEALVDDLEGRVTAAVATSASLAAVATNMNTVLSRVTGNVALAASLVQVASNMSTVLGRVTAPVATAASLAALSMSSSAPTVDEINARLAASHGAGAWGSAVSGWTLVNQTTLDTGAVALGPVTINSDPYAGVIVTAYASGDTNRSTPIASDVTDGSGYFAFYLDSGSYVIVASYQGVTFPERTITVA